MTIVRKLPERASETLGREVRLDGPMSLKLFPWLALEISDVHVGNPPGFGEAAPLAEARPGNRLGTGLATGSW